MNFTGNALCSWKKAKACVEALEKYRMVKTYNINYLYILADSAKWRPKSPNMYLIKCCGANNNCLNRSPKTRPPRSTLQQVKVKIADWNALENP
jgi:hypothetical protein